MKRLMAIGAAAAMAGSATAQNAVQWRVEDGGNGHWYALVDEAMSWQDAKDRCTADGGHLATASSPAENAFIAAATRAPHSWLGGYQDVNSTEYSEPAGAWRWLTGESMTYTAWYPGEPNNFPPGLENFLATAYGTPNWVDLPGDWTLPFHIEWSADCNADGIVDYGQILAGELADANHNNIPDCCENGTPCGCAGDTNTDGTVDGIDLATILTRWGQPGAKFPAADCNNDGAIDGTDLAIVLAGWGGCP